MHTSLLVSYHRKQVMIDCGESWRGRLGEVQPDALVVTHADPDHVGGLESGVDCPVYATDDAWKGMGGLQRRGDNDPVIRPPARRATDRPRAGPDTAHLVPQ